MGGRSGQSIQRGGGGGTTSSATTRATAQSSEANREFNGKITGYKANIVRVTALPNGYTDKDMLEMAGIPTYLPGRVDINSFRNEVTVSIVSQGVKMVRQIDVENKKVYNSYFRINDESRHRGKGFDIFESQVKALTSRGFKEIGVMAAGAPGSTTYNGYYTWAAFGYVPNGIDYYINRVNRSAGTNYRSWGEIVGTRKGLGYWKQYGINFSGTFDLTKGSNSLKQLEAYGKYRRSQRNS